MGRRIQYANVGTHVVSNEVRAAEPKRVLEDDVLMLPVIESMRVVTRAKSANTDADRLEAGAVEVNAAGAEVEGAG
jgi:hypothetical protein